MIELSQAEADRLARALAWARQHEEACRTAGITARRRRGARKDVGGRPAYRLDTDPDRKVIICALAIWPWSRSTATLQLLDNLLTPHASVKLKFGTQLGRSDRTWRQIFGPPMVDGVAYRSLTVENIEPPRKLGTNSPSRRPTSAPGRRSFRRSRLQHLKAKIDHYRRAKLCGLEASFYKHALLGLKALIAGDRRAELLLASAGWTISEAEQSRLVELFRFSNKGCFP